MVVPWPGTGTKESRGIEMRVLGPLPTCSIMIVSVRCPAALPVPSFLRSSAERPRRLAEPTSR